MANFNFPTPPQRGFDSSAFPGDLISGGRNFYTDISFAQYSGGSAGIAFGGNIKLPIPRKLNDNEVMIWEEWSGTQAAVSGLGAAAQLLASSRGFSVAGALSSGAMAFAGDVGSALSIYSGKTINPHMFMMFKRPNFKEHTLQWTLTPNSQGESESLSQIIKKMKKAALPDTGTFIMDYPELAIIRLVAGGGDNYLYKFKPCAIISVQVDYTGSGQPSFFKSGAPTVVNLTLQLKEVELWSKNDDL